MRGDKVIVRTPGNKPKVCRVWDVDEVAAFVHDKENYQRRKDGLSHLQSVAFPRKDVFTYDPAMMLYPGISERKPAPAEWWERLIVYR